MRSKRYDAIGEGWSIFLRGAWWIRGIELRAHLQEQAASRSFLAGMPPIKTKFSTICVAKFLSPRITLLHCAISTPRFLSRDKRRTHRKRCCCLTVDFASHSVCVCALNSLTPHKTQLREAAWRIFLSPSLFCFVLWLTGPDCWRNNPFRNWFRKEVRVLHYGAIKSLLASKVGFVNLISLYKKYHTGEKLQHVYFWPGLDPGLFTLQSGVKINYC